MIRGADAPGEAWIEQFAVEFLGDLVLDWARDRVDDQLRVAGDLTSESSNRPHKWVEVPTGRPLEQGQARAGEAVLAFRLVRDEFARVALASLVAALVVPLDSAASIGNARYEYLEQQFQPRQARPLLVRTRRTLDAVREALEHRRRPLEGDRQR